MKDYRYTRVCVCIYYVLKIIYLYTYIICFVKILNGNILYIILMYSQYIGKHFTRGSYISINVSTRAMERNQSF